MAHMGGVVCGGGGRSFACSDQRPGTDVGERRRETVRHLPASLLTQHSLSSSLQLVLCVENSNRALSL
jgi:hypothetical protein